mgnify:CR=1 FL=1
MRVPFYILALLTVLTTGCAPFRLSVEADLDHMESLRQKLNERDSDFGDRVIAAYRSRFAAKFDPEHLAVTSNSDLQLLFDAAYLASAVSLGKPKIMPLRNLKAALTELDRRNLATYAYGVSYSLYVKARLFEEARLLFRDHRTPSMEALPEIVDLTNSAIGARVLTIDTKRRLLTVRVVDMRQGLRIIVVSHPECHFSKNAYHGIAAHPQMSRIFAKYALWLAPVATGIDFATLQEWNQVHPDAATSIAYAQDEWPMLEDWSTPTFYFVSDGRVVSRVSGWPQEGRIGELLRAAKKVGIAK